jgi:hypothetical protein
MTRRALPLALLATLAVAVTAHAAAKAGSYTGVSVNKEIYGYGDVDPKTDKGKVTFTVKSNTVLKFKLTGQQFMCGSQPVPIAVSVAKMKLSSTGAGKGTFKDPNVGAFKVAIKVTSTGKATGTITPQNLCRGKVTFSAKR